MKIKYFTIMLFVVLSSNIFTNQIFLKLDNKMKETNSLVCVGLDPDITKIPSTIMDLDISVEEKVYMFLTEVIDITSPYACCFKIQKAFFDQFTDGHNLLKKVVYYIHQHHNDLPAFLDCKIGDVGNTMQIYMENIFDNINVDGVVINPYMGEDVFIPFMEDSKKIGIVLIQTSNPNAQIVQNLELKNGKKLWEEMLLLTMQKWNKNQNLIPVLSSNVQQENYNHIRKLIPQDVPILLAGIGLQSGNPKVMKQLLNDNKRGVFVNSSRGILYPYRVDDIDWKEKVLKAVIELKNTLNEVRYND